MNWENFATFFASATTALATAFLAIYAWRQHRHAQDLQRREETPHVVLTDRRAEPDHAHNEVILVNLSAHPIWVQQVLLKDRLTPVNLDLAEGPRGGKSGLMKPGDWTAFDPAPLAKVVDEGLGQIQQHFADYETEVLLSFLYSPTSEHAHQKQWLVRRHGGFLWTKPLVDEG